MNRPVPVWVEDALLDPRVIWALVLESMKEGAKEGRFPWILVAYMVANHNEVPGH